MKIHPVGDDLLHADRGTVSQTNMTKLIVAFRNFANAHKNRPETIASQLLLLQFFLGGGLMKTRRRWAGHVTFMEEMRIPTEF